MQFVSTLLLNLSTGAAVSAHAVPAERRYVWVPDATGTAGMAISGNSAQTAKATG